MADGSVKIDVQLLLNGADKDAKALKGDLQGIDIKTSAADHAKLLADAIKRASTAAKQGETAQNALRTSLESQAKTWDKLADAQEKAGLKTSSQVSKLNSLKAQLASTSVATEQANQKFKDAVVAEGENSDAAKDAAQSYSQLKGEQAALGVQVSALEKRFGGLTPAMAAAADKANAIGDKFQSIGSKISSVGNKMTIGLSAPIAAGFALAGKAAVTFDSQIQSMGSLLDDGTISASTLKSELKGLGDASKSWSTQYGVSTSSINDGMSELIKKGYTYNQVLGAMPSILDAARASGDDFNSVMSVSTSVLEQFGLKSNNTATMLKNTQRVTDSLSYVANKTSAGFSDMGEAMEYVGPVANGLHMSLEQTAAAIGLMSNQGIEGEKAGTALRGALSQLMNPSKQNEIGFKRLGISVTDFKKGTIGLPEIIDSIRASSKGMAAQQLQSNLALAFGTEAVSGMNILVNKGGDALRNMTTATQGATGYTKKLAETMNNTAQANVDKFKASLNVLAITAGQKLLPQINELVKSGTDLVKWFNDLDSGTQSTIIKTLALTAAVGPLLSGIGKMSSGIGAVVHGGTGVISFLSRFAGGASKTRSETEILGEMLDLLKGKTGTVAAGLETATGAVAKTGAGMAAAETGSAGFLASLAPIAPALIGVGVAAAAGVAYWELYGKEAQASSDRASRWGTDIGAAADKSAGKMADASGKISGALTDTNHTVQENAKTIVTGFDSMTAAAKKAANESNTAAQKMAKSLGGSAGSALLAAAAKEKSANDKRIKQMQAYSRQAEQITSNANKTGQALTADQIQVLSNLRQSAAAQAVKTMQLSGKEQNNVLKAILGEKVTMSQASAQKQYENMQNNLQKEYQAESKAKEQINKNDQLTTAEKNAAIEGLEKDHQAKLDAIYQGAIQAMKAQGMSNTEIQQKLQSDFDLTASKAKGAMDTYTNAMAKGVKSNEQFAASVTDNMSKATKKAGNDWNSLVLDPKTGKVVTNLDQVLKDTASTKAGWDRLAFDLKHANLSSNAKETVLAALIQTDTWNKMPIDQREAIMKTAGKQDLSDIITELGLWNKLTPTQLAAVVKGDSSSLVAAIDKVHEWDKLTPSQLALIVKDKATVPIITAMEKAGTWNNMTVDEKNAVVNAKGAPALADIVIKYGLWDQLPEKQKNLLVNNDDARAKLFAAGILVDKYNLKNPNTKHTKAKDDSVATVIAKTNAGIQKANGVNFTVKHTKAKDDTVGSTVANTNSLIKQSNGIHFDVKHAKAKDDSVGTTTAKANKDLNGFNRNNPQSKNLKAGYTEPGYQTVMNGINTFKSKKSEKKSFISEFISIFTTHKKKAHGDTYFGGGLATVNDQYGSVYREAIRLPTGETFSFKERNVTGYFPRGTEIVPAAKSLQAGLVPRYANGTGGQLTDAIDRAAVSPIWTMTAESASSFVPQSMNLSMDSKTTAAFGAITAALGKVQEALVSMSEQSITSGDAVIRIENVTQLDKKVLSRQIAPDVRVDLNRIDRMNSRRKGITG